MTTYEKEFFRAVWARAHAVSGRALCLSRGCESSGHGLAEDPATIKAELWRDLDAFVEAAKGFREARESARTQGEASAIAG